MLRKIKGDVTDIAVTKFPKYTRGPRKQEGSIDPRNKDPAICVYAVEGQRVRV
jgi:hypothetical protein